MLHIGKSRKPSRKKKRGLSLENTCDSPFLPGWKLELMAKKVFENYIQNTSETINLAYRMLLKHIADAEEIIDHSDTIQRKQEELEKLNKKTNLLVMREDGDIDKDYFRERKKELETLIETLQIEIQNLSPKPTLQRDIDYQAILADLQKRLESYV